MNTTSAGETGNRYKWTNRRDAKKIEADLLVTFKNPSATTNQLLTTIKQNLIFRAAQMPKIPRWFFFVSFFSGPKWVLNSSVLNVLFVEKFPHHLKTRYFPWFLVSVYHLHRQVPAVLGYKVGKLETLSPSPLKIKVHWWMGHPEMSNKTKTNNKINCNRI